PSIWAPFIAKFAMSSAMGSPPRTSLPRASMTPTSPTCGRLSPMPSVSNAGSPRFPGTSSWGGQYAVEGNASGTITACEEGRHFAGTWEFMGHVSWIEVYLEPAGEGTRLELHHIAPHPNPHWDSYGAGAGGVGWELGLLGL